MQSPSESNTEHFHSCLLFVSFTEIYGDSIYDLLDPEKRHRPLDEWPRAQVLETEDGLVIRGINVFQVQTAEDALNLFFMGNTNRCAFTPL